MLKSKVIEVNQLNGFQKARMYTLLEANYNKTNPFNFVDDLSNKTKVILLLDKQDTIQGFSTLGVNLKNSGTTTYNVLFSGDTIINPEFWGTQELTKAFIVEAGRLVASDPLKIWYWFLISKGHRTYMYLPLFLNQYYPSVEHQNDFLESRLDQISSTMFKDNWNPDTGLLVFPESLGELTPELVEGTYNRQQNKHVGFFIEKNPKFYEGE